MRHVRQSSAQRGNWSWSNGGDLIKRDTNPSFPRVFHDSFFIVSLYRVETRDGLLYVVYDASASAVAPSELALNAKRVDDGAYHVLNFIRTGKHASLTVDDLPNVSGKLICLFACLFVCLCLPVYVCLFTYHVLNFIRTGQHALL